MATQKQIDFLDRRLDGVAARADVMIERQLRAQEEAQARADATAEEARRQRARSYAESCRQYAARYDDSYAAFNVQVPQPVDGENPEKYRNRLFNRLVRKLPEGHKWQGVRADDLALGAPMDTVEEMVLEAAKAEGLQPSFDNLPSTGEMIERRRADDAGSKITEFFGRESYIKSMGRPGRRVLRLVNPKDGRVLLGAPFPRAD